MERWDGAGMTSNARKLPWAKCVILGHPTETVAVSSTKMLDPGDIMIIPISDASAEERHVIDMFKAISHKVDEEIAREGCMCMLLSGMCIGKDCVFRVMLKVCMLGR